MNSRSELGPNEMWQQDLVFDAEDREQPIVGRLYAEGDDTELRFVVLQPPLATPGADVQPPASAPG